MSTKDGSIMGKPLKGGKGANDPTMDLSDLVALLSSGNVTLSGVTLEDVSIFGTSLNDVTIGDIIPSDGIFKNLRVGKPGTGGDVYFYGDNADNNNVAIDYMYWDSGGAILNIFGGLVVRDPAQFGNIIIRDNDIVAINTDGDINLIPESSNASIFIAGNMRQSVLGDIEFNLADNYSVKSNTTTIISNDGDTLIGSRDGTVTISADAFRDPSNITSITYDAGGSIINTDIEHNLEIGDSIIVSETTIDGTYTVSEILSPKIFKTIISTIFTSQTSGIVSPVKSGVLNLYGGNSVNFRDNVPLIVGQDGNHIKSIGNNLRIKSDYLSIIDPIPILRTETGVYSDSGIGVKYGSKTGFFGFKGTTENFTWIPDSIITETATGKQVSGVAGIMELQGLVVNILGGNPDLLIKVTGITTFDTTQINIGNNTPINIGTTGSISSNGTDTIISTSTGCLVVNSDICLDEQYKISFSNTTTQTISASGTGLQITSDIIHLNGILDLESIQFEFEGNTIYNDGNNLYIESITNLVLNPGANLHLPEDVFFQIGDTTGTGIYGSNGSIFWNTVTDTNITADRYVNITSNAGRVYINAAQVYYPQNSELLFGLGTFISTVQNGILNLTSTNIISLNGNTLELNFTKISIPNNTLLCIGDSGDEIHYNSTTDTLHLNAESFSLTADVVINGTFLVNGASSIVSSVITVFNDPVIRLAGESPLLDVKSRGIDFIWYDGPTQKTGFIGLNQQLKKFVLSKDGVTTFDIYNHTELGDLLIDTLYASNVITDQFTTSIITGNPDLTLQAVDMYMNATNKIIIPVEIFIESGQTSIGSTGPGGTTFRIEAPEVNLPSGNLTIGATELTMLDLNNFSIKNVQNIILDANVSISSSLSFGNTGVSISVDAQNNILFTSSLGGDTIFSGTAVLDGGMDMGNSVMEWSSTNRPGGEIVWHNTLPNTELNVCIKGNLYCANWRGEPISIDYGGTGHDGAWTPRSIVYVGDSGNELSEDPDVFVYNATLQTMGIRTLDPQNVITIGSGNIDFLDNQACILFRHDTFLRYAIGKVGRHFVINGTPLTGITDKNVLTPLLTINKYGQMGIGVDTPFMDALGGLTTEGKLYVCGDIRLCESTDGIYFSNTEYITGENGTLSFFSNSTITFNSNVLFGQNAYFYDTSTRIYGSSGGDITIESTNLTNLKSPIVNVEGSLCLHYNNFTSQCEMYIKRNEINSNLEIVNLNADILLNPQTSIIIPDNKQILLGSNGIITVDPSEMKFKVNTGDISFESVNVNVNGGSKLKFFDETASFTSSIYQTATNLTVKNTSSILLDTSLVFLPIGTPLYFGTTDTGLSSTLTNLQLFGLNNIDIYSPNINVIDGSLLNFYAPTVPNTFSSIYQTDTNLIITGIFPLNINVPIINLPVGTEVVFGDTDTRISSDSGGILQLYGLNKITLETPKVSLDDGSKLCFNAPNPSILESCIYQTNDCLVIQGNNCIDFQSDVLKLPYESEIQFGDSTQRITSTLNSIEIYSPDLINIVSNNVRITGNLVVDKKSTFTIEAETSFDSGIIDLGGAQMINITLFGTYLGTQTLVTVASNHNLLVGDTITIFDSIPNLDGDYVITQVPTPTTFSINIPFTGLEIGSISPYGRIRTVLIDNPANDIGVQVSWHTGVTVGTDESRIGFFGVRRSDLCWTYIPEATRINDTFFGSPGNICVGNITANGINVSELLGPLYTSTYQVSGSNFIINGGNINNTPIGIVTPEQGHFTNLTSNSITISPGGGACIPKLLCNIDAGVYQVLGSNFIINGGLVNNVVIGGTTPNEGNFTILTADTITLTSGACIPNLLCNLDTSTYKVSGSNFVIIGGSINSTPIGVTAPNEGNFTNLSTNTLIITSNTLVSNLNADLLDGLDSTYFITIDGHTQLINNWNSGTFTITSGGFTDTSLDPTSIVFSGSGGELITDNMFTYNSTIYTLFSPNITATGTITTNELDATSISGYSLTGNIVGTGTNTISNVVLDNVTICNSIIKTSDLTLSVGDTFDGSLGTVVFSNDQLSGEYISGGTADVDISGNSETVTNGLYTTMFQNDYTIIKADSAGNPVELFVPENTVIGRQEGGLIEAIPISVLGGGTSNLYVPNSILFADSTVSPINVTPLVVPFNTFVGRGPTGEITVLSSQEALDILNIQPNTEQKINDNGGLLKSGHLNFPDGGTMTGLLFTAFERFSITTGSTQDLDTNVETSYIMVNYSIVGGRIATCTLGAGIADGHRKLIIVSSIANNAALRVNLSFVSTDTADFGAFVFLHKGQSVMLQWDTVMAAWVGINTGPFVATSAELTQPDWLECFTGENDEP
jgi:hypothetical protein